MRITSHGTGKLWPPTWSTYTKNGFRSTWLRAMEIEGPIFQLLICLGVLVLTLLHPWVRRVASVGLPLCYLLSLAMIHWLGGLIHAIPLGWSLGPDTYTEVGFRQAFVATVACAIGSLLVAPFVLRMMLRGEATPVVQSPSPDQARLSHIYLWLGIIFFAVLVPLLRSIPSISAVSVAGVHLALVGICLACWKAYLEGSYVKLTGWLLLVCSIPFVT